VTPPSLTVRSTIGAMRVALLVILFIGVVGTEIELFLLGHTEGAWQLVPIVLDGVALVVLAWYCVRRSAAAVRALQVTMVAFLLSGVIGVWLHFQGNIGYERDSNPSLSMRELVRAAIWGSTPTLAPGTMIQLGLVGLVFAFRHPKLRPMNSDDESPSDRSTT